MYDSLRREPFAIVGWFVETVICVYSGILGTILIVVNEKKVDVYLSLWDGRGVINIWDFENLSVKLIEVVK